jgi:hypothetical protein
LGVIFSSRQSPTSQHPAAFRAISGENLLKQSATTILLYGRTHSGKTAQIGKLAEYVYKNTGKITRLYTADKGGLDVIQPYIDLGIIELIEIHDSNPWIFLNKAVRGFVRDGSKWVLDKERNAKVGCYAFESLRGFAEVLMLDMAEKAAAGVSIGGGSNISFQVQGDGETIKVGGGNMAHFGVAQSRMTAEVWESQKLDADFILWTSSVSKDDDTNSGGKVLGPDVIGKALTAEVPRWFNYTFRIDGLPAAGGKAERHILYLGSHVDVGAGNAAALGNIRRPLDAGDLKSTTIEPADIVVALTMLREQSTETAKQAIARRLGMKVPS